MSIEDFARLVAEMREAQKAFFKGLSTIDLQLSKQLERQVDEAVKSILNPPMYTQEEFSLWATQTPESTTRRKPRRMR